MYLKSIEIQGFKSFANKTLFEFHNGITCIVGPNGSGKSNVADAVRWVLGEQSAKQLRGSNMQDVIFSGTEARKPQGFASVAITFDNSDRHLNLDYNEVTVARRVYRSGESEYILNGTQCRLKDVAELLYDTGIGKEGYSIIGQGQIDKILSTKPEDRRELFDEAAGIVKYKRRKAAAAKRLESEQANMVRLSDIMSELEKQVGPLERQSKAAREFLRLRDELKQLDINAYVYESGRLETSLKEIDNNLEIATGDYDETQKNSAALKHKYESQQEELRRLEELLNTLREEISARQSEKQEVEGNIKVLNEQINTENLRKEHTAQRMLVLRKEKDEYRERSVAMEQKRQECNRDIYDTETACSRIRAEIEMVSANISEFQRALKDEQGKMIDLLNEKSSFVGELQKYETMLEQAKAELGSQNARFLQSQTDISVWEKNETQFREEYEKICRERKELTQRQEEAVKESEEAQSAREELKDQYYEQRRLHQVSVTRAESLRNLAERYEGYGNSIRKIMEVRDRNPGIHGVVADLIHVDQKYETAIETALGGAIQNIVTDTEKTAKGLIEYLKRNKLGRATFLPLDAITVRDEFHQKAALSEPGVIGLANSLVTAKDCYRNLLDFLLGRIVVVDNIDHGMKVSAKYRRSLRIVTLEGELLNPGGSMTGGAFRNTSNLLGRNRELEELEKRIVKEEGLLKQLSADFEKASADADRLEKETQQLRSRLQNYSLKETEGRLRLRDAERRKQELTGDREQLDNEITLQREKIRSIQENYNKVRGSIERIDSAGDQSQTSVSQNQESADAENEKKEKLTQALSEQLLKASALEQENKHCSESIQNAQEEIRRRDEEELQLIEDDKACSEAVKQKTVEIETARKHAGELGEELREKEETLKENNIKRNTVSDALTDFFTKLEEFTTRISALDRDILRLNNQKEKQEERLDALVEYLWTEYELRPSDAKAAFAEDGPAYSELKQKIAELKRSIKALGNVNVNAIDEFKEVSERYTFMKEQYNDLTESEKSLKKIINELDEGMRRQFEEKFAQIKTEFDKVFRELFGGGKGTLELVEDEDIIEAGIRIISQPPGKKLQNMMQLSGGEKALTAIALMFAIQNLKPSPFCLLDEIEAALDDSNVGRFAGYLHKLTNNTQFIVITHRRGTMTSADRLYGITMQEKGVSTLVSVNLIEQQLDK